MLSPFGHNVKQQANTSRASLLRNLPIGPFASKFLFFSKDIYKTT